MGVFQEKISWISWILNLEGFNHYSTYSNSSITVTTTTSLTPTRFYVAQLSISSFVICDTLASLSIFGSTRNFFAKMNENKFLCILLGGPWWGDRDPASHEKIEAYPASHRIFRLYPVSRSMLTLCSFCIVFFSEKDFVYNFIVDDYFAKYCLIY